MNTFILILFSTFAFSQDFVFDKEKGRAIPSYIGQIKLMKGKVFKKNAEGTQEISNGERFRKNDVLITDDKSFARIQIVDDTLISIGPKSEFRFDDFDFKDKMDRKLSFTLLKGQLTGNIKNKAKPGDIQFKTKYTTMGVRGTYVLMNHQSKNSLDIAEYALLSGKIEVQDSNRRVIPLSKGEKLVLIHDSSRQIADNEKLSVSEEEFDKLEAKALDEENNFKPFLPYFNINDVSSTSPLYQIVNTSASPQASEVGTVNEKRKEKSFSLDEKLDQLNQKLRENQKRR